MKKILVALVAALGLVSVSANALPGGPFIPVVAAGGSSLPVWPVAVIGGVMVYAATTTPHYSLSESCKLKNVQKEGANYSFASYEHCK